jgi:hypothetical protein
MATRTMFKHLYHFSAIHTFLEIVTNLETELDSLNQCCGTVTIYYGSGSSSDVPTFDKLWFRFRLIFRLQFWPCIETIKSSFRTKNCL